MKRQPHSTASSSPFLYEFVHTSWLNLWSHICFVYKMFLDDLFALHNKKKKKKIRKSVQTECPPLESMRRWTMSMQQRYLWCVTPCKSKISIDWTVEIFLWCCFVHLLNFVINIACLNYANYPFNFLARFCNIVHHS